MSSFIFWLHTIDQQISKNIGRSPLITGFGCVVLSCHFFTEKINLSHCRSSTFCRLRFGHFSCPFCWSQCMSSTFCRLRFPIPCQKHPMHQPMYDILAGPPLLPTSFVRTLDHNVGPQLFADFVFIHLDKHIIHTWNEIADWCMPYLLVIHFYQPIPSRSMQRGAAAVLRAAWSIRRSILCCLGVFKI